MSEAPRTVEMRITDYLFSGGLFNPELANHDAVRDLLIDASDALTAERERADRNQEDALTLMRALIKVRQQMFPQHDQRAVVSRDFPKLAAIDAARRK